MLEILFVLGIAVIVWVIVSQMRDSRMSVSRMWVIPALMVFLSFGSLTTLPLNNVLNIALLLSALGAGAILGVMREAFKTIIVNRADGEIIVKGTPIGILIWIGAIIFERYIKEFLHDSKGIVTPQLLPAALLILSLSAVIARRAYLYWKYFKIST